MPAIFSLYTAQIIHLITYITSFVFFSNASNLFVFNKNKNRPHVTNPVVAVPLARSAEHGDARRARGHDLRLFILPLLLGSSEGLYFARLLDIFIVLMMLNYVSTVETHY